ncbi:MAG: four helix bundle protein [Verrucomicrobiota bacterium]
MNKEELKLRTKVFGLRSMKLVRKFPKDVPGKVIAHQLMRSAVSVGANYRSACRARSNAEFIAKLGIVLEETDESAHWLDMIIEDGMLPSRLVQSLFLEADELCAIFYSAISTLRSQTKILNVKS